MISCEELPDAVDAEEVELSEVEDEEKPEDVLAGELDVELAEDKEEVDPDKEVVMDELLEVLWVFVVEDLLLPAKTNAPAAAIIITIMMTTAITARAIP